MRRRAVAAMAEADRTGSPVHARSGAVARVGEVVAMISAIAGCIREISDVATSIAAAVEKQGAAPQEIARNVTQTSGLGAEAARFLDTLRAGPSG